MIRSPIKRRHFLQGAGALAAATTLPLSRVAAAAPAELTPIALPPPISSAERLQRLAKARALMNQHGIGAIIVESGPSLDYFTGVQWWRSERLTGAVIPASGQPIIVTPFFERPSVEKRRDDDRLARRGDHCARQPLRSPPLDPSEIIQARARFDDDRADAVLLHQTLRLRDSREPLC